MVLVFAGVTMFWFKIPLAGTLVLSPSMTPLLTALWVIGITNAINLIDGLDGLAAGIVAIASGALAVYGFRLVESGSLPAGNLGPLIAVITCGICVGFLPHNFNPAKVFMGDAGALFLGLLMAASTMEIGGRTTGVTGQTYFFFAPLFLPVFILGVPIADMAFAYIRRAAKGTSFDTPDNDHVHHRLVRLGHGPRRTVLILWTWTAVLSAFVLFPLFAPASNALIPFAAVVLGLLLYTLFHPGVRIERRRARRLAARQAAEAARAAANGAAGGSSGAPARCRRRGRERTGERAPQRSVRRGHRRRPHQRCSGGHAGRHPWHRRAAADGQPVEQRRAPNAGGVERRGQPVSDRPRREGARHSAELIAAANESLLRHGVSVLLFGLGITVICHVLLTSGAMAASRAGRERDGRAGGRRRRRPASPACPTHVGAGSRWPGPAAWRSPRPASQRCWSPGSDGPSPPLLGSRRAVDGAGSTLQPVRRTGHAQLTERGRAPSATTALGAKLHG